MFLSYYEYQLSKASTMSSELGINDSQLEVHISICRPVLCCLHLGDAMD